MKKLCTIILLIYLIQPKAGTGTRQDTNENAIEVYAGMKRREAIDRLKSSEFSPARLITYLRVKEIKNAHIVYRQVILETGYFTSIIFMENNNLIGMKLPNTRKSKATGRNRGHATYNHWTDCIDDYVLWQKYWEEKNGVIDDYYTFLKELPYAEDINYINKLKHII